jgi:predicted Zn-dependent peptidase
VTAGCLPAKVDDVLAVSREELAKVAREGLTEEEVVRAKGQLRGGLVLGLEDTGSRMSRLGESELFHERILGVDEVLDRIDAVSVADVHQVASDLFGGNETLALVGPS